MSNIVLKDREGNDETFVGAEVLRLSDGKGNYTRFIEEPAGDINISKNGTYDVAKYGNAIVNVPVTEGGIVPQGTLFIPQNGIYDVTDKAAVNVKVPTGDSALPIEVSTEAEMTALLTSGEVGGVYKYTGETTDTYENGALYVLEADKGTFIHKYTGGSTESTAYEFEVGMTWAEWVESEYDSNRLVLILEDGTVHWFGGSGGSILYKNSVACKSTYEIIDGGIYTSTYLGGGGSND